MSCTSGRRRSRYLVLPDNNEIGWTPFLWLIYLLSPFLVLILGGSRPLDWVLAVVVEACFLPLYFWGYWSTGRRLLAIIAAITALGALYTPLNSGGLVFFVYAAAFVGWAVNRRLAFSVLCAILAAFGLEAWLFQLHPGTWIPGITFSALIGLSSLHYSEVQRKNRGLQRAREEVERLAKVAERERIARDLHDLLGHTLTLISVKSDLAVKLSALDPDRARAEMAEVHRTARTALAEVRRAVRGYREGGTGGLRHELETVRASLAAGGLALRVEGSPEELIHAGDGALTAEKEEALAFALREAATNVLRHARASRCEIRFERVGPPGAPGRGDRHDTSGRTNPIGPAGRSERPGSLGTARLQIIDDGRGGSRARQAEGNGLGGMRERVERLGGRLTLDGHPDTGGTSLTVELPLSGPEERTDPAEDDLPGAAVGAAS